MTGRPAALAATLLLLACNGGEEPVPAPERSDGPRAQTTSVTPAPSAASAPSPAAPEQSGPAWDLVSSGEGAALIFPASGKAAIRLFCPAGQDRILVNVPDFRPIASEERLSFGGGGNAYALVADTKGDRRGGVSGTGAVPGNLAALIGGPVSASYGAQTSGPHAAPPQNLARAFAAACGEGAPRPQPSPSASQVSACLMQEGKRLSVTPLRAVGNEPFWGARIEGRCVTYSHPQDQQGARVWTQYTANSRGGGTWTGALEGARFVLRTRPQPGCSDGMSDKRYPLAVELTVGGEERRGCAEPRR